MERHSCYLGNVHNIFRWLNDVFYNNVRSIASSSSWWLLCTCVRWSDDWILVNFFSLSLPWFSCKPFQKIKYIMLICICINFDSHYFNLISCIQSSHCSFDCYFLYIYIYIYFFFFSFFNFVPKNFISFNFCIKFDCHLVFMPSMLLIVLTVICFVLKFWMIRNFALWFFHVFLLYLIHEFWRSTHFFKIHFLEIIFFFNLIL